MNTSKTRNLYYVMDEKEEMFVKGNLNNHENSYTGEIFTKLIAMGEIER